MSKDYELPDLPDLDLDEEASKSENYKYRLLLSIVAFVVLSLVLIPLKGLTTAIIIMIFSLIVFCIFHDFCKDVKDRDGQFTVALIFTGCALSFMLLVDMVHQNVVRHKAQVQAIEKAKTESVTEPVLQTSSKDKEQDEEISDLAELALNLNEEIASLKCDNINYKIDAYVNKNKHDGKPIHVPIECTTSDE